MRLAIKQVRDMILFEQAVNDVLETILSNMVNAARKTVPDAITSAGVNTASKSIVVYTNFTRGPLPGWSGRYSAQQLKDSYVHNAEHRYAELGYDNDLIDPDVIDAILSALQGVAGDNDMVLLYDADRYTGRPDQFHIWTFTFSESSVHKDTKTAGEMPAIVYHVTDKKYVASIERDGLRPRRRIEALGTSDLKYGPRVYVTATKQFALAFADDAPGEFDPVFLAIDTAKLPEDTVFYRDEEFGGWESAYTLQNIPARAIRRVDM